MGGCQHELVLRRNIVDPADRHSSMPDVTTSTALVASPVSQDVALPQHPSAVRNGHVLLRQEDELP